MLSSSGQRRLAARRAVEIRQEATFVRGAMRRHSEGSSASQAVIRIPGASFLASAIAVSCVLTVTIFREWPVMRRSSGRHGPALDVGPDTPDRWLFWGQRIFMVPRRLTYHRPAKSQAAIALDIFCLRNHSCGRSAYLPRGISRRRLHYASTTPPLRLPYAAASRAQCRRMQPCYADAPDGTA